MTSSSSRTFTTASSSGTSSTARKKDSSLNPETNLTRIGKLDNSASMQRAIERVSRERNVKKNDPPSVPRKEKRGTAAATVTTAGSTATSSSNSNSSASHSTGRGSVVASHAHVSSAKSLNGSSSKRSKKATDVSKKLSSTKSTRSTSLKNVTTRDGSGASISSSSSSSSSSVSSKKSTVSKVNVMDTVLEETLETFKNESFVNDKEMGREKLNDKGENNNDVTEKEEILHVETSIPIKEEHN